MIPLIRIDDFPTGVRPLLDDLTPFVKILQEFDKLEEQFILGVVPYLLTKIEAGIIDEIKKLRNVVFAQHGFEHNYGNASRKLSRAKDKFNERNTVGIFDEFQGKSENEIYKLLDKGKGICFEILDYRPLVYIPPCNQGNELHGKVVGELFDSYYSEKMLPNCKAQWIRSAFYDRLNKMNKRPKGVCTFHVTWEWDTVRKVGFEKWKEGMNKLK